MNTKRLAQSACALFASACLTCAGSLCAREDGTVAAYEHVARNKELVAQRVQRSEPVDDSGMPASCWLTVEGTPIDYPVMEPDGDSPHGWYLTHDAWGTPSGLGALYIDTRTSSTRLHVLVYGHKAGSSNEMFGSISDAYLQKRFERIGNAQFLDRDGWHTFEPLCALKVPADYQDIQRFSWADPTCVGAFVNDIAQQADARSSHWRAQSLAATRVLTLVTCTQATPGGNERTLLLFTEQEGPSSALLREPSLR